MHEPILIVDDNALNLKLEKVLLSIDGYNNIHTASDAEEVLMILKTYHPQMILMNLVLPGMSGLELTTKLKTDPKYSDIIIIAVTGCAMEGDKEKALAAGCDGYITKPINTETFSGIIQNFLLHKKRDD